MFSIGPYLIEPPAALAPMAGITDKPFRQLARRFGAGYAVSEMLNSDPSLRHTKKSLHRSDFSGEDGVRAVQIVGSDPQRMAEAARYNAEQGAQIIDINMGCPAKKVCNVLSGSALLQNEKLVGDILTTVVAAAGVPVTLKTRLGFCENNKNIRTIAKMAEQAGIAALAVHGRTREQMYKGDASYELIAQVRQDISIPLWVNGDITSAEKAAAVLRQTGADGVMVGRGAQGRPWLFAEIKHFLQHGTPPSPIAFQTAADAFLQHLQAMYAFYGDTAGARIARKHIGWYTAPFADGAALRKQANALDSADAQYDAVAAFLAAAPERQSGLWPSETAASANKI